jgi:CRP/FNR family nitrogen fixation transcriptional regulator
MYSRAAFASVSSHTPPLTIEPIATGPFTRTAFVPLRHYRKDEEVFGEGTPARCYYKVVSGVVRTCKILSDGRRQIDAFHVAGDIFGIERGTEYRLTAEAVGEAMIASFWRCSLEEPADPDRGLAREVVATALLNLERAQEHMILLGRKSATEKVATFLLNMAKRIEGDSIELPMSRSDIADYLGLTVETVSRTLTQFERKGAIELSTARRTIRLRDEAALRRP